MSSARSAQVEEAEHLAELEAILSAPVAAAEAAAAAAASVSASEAGRASRLTVTQVIFSLDPRAITKFCSSHYAPLALFWRYV